MLSNPTVFRYPSETASSPVDETASSPAHTANAKPNPSIMLFMIDLFFRIGLSFLYFAMV